MSGPKPVGVFKSQHVAETEPGSSRRRDPAAERRALLQQTLAAEARNRAALKRGIEVVSRLSEGAVSCVSVTRLSEPERSSAEALSRAAIDLDPTTWAEVLEERQLGLLCAWPACSNEPRAPYDDRYMTSARSAMVRDPARVVD